MKTILKLLLDSVMEFVLAFYEGEKAKANEYTLLSQKKLIESIVDVSKAELKINKEVGLVSISPRAWNQGRKLGLALALASLLFLSGCLVQTVFVHQPLPIIVIPVRRIIKPKMRSLLIHIVFLEPSLDSLQSLTTTPCFSIPTDP